ncbi:MAG: hypothetical protein HRU06_05825 [Oceanospirillaceae bacterium]|nr:hypothetical protein [Oceanospirillaceae bacterium]
MKKLQMLLSYAVAIIITGLLIAAFATIGFVAIGIVISLFIAAAIYRTWKGYKFQRDFDPVVRTY